MLKNDEDKVLDKMIRVIFLALLGSLLSTLYLNKMHTADVSYDKIQTSATDVAKESIFKSPN